MRRRIMASVGGKTLPYDAEVEWLKSDGSAYILTDNYFQDFDLIESSFSFDDNTISGEFCLDGVVKPIHIPLEYRAKTICDYSVIYSRGQLSTIFASSINLGKRYELRSECGTHNYKVTFDGVVKLDRAFPDGVVKDSTFEWPVFGLSRQKGKASNIFNGMVHYYRLSYNGNAIKDFIPVRFTNENGVSDGAMFDRVSGKLFRNHGTGAFIIGPDK